MRNGMMREKGNQGRSAGGLGVPKNVPGMFSDDESESDAGRSSDTDRDDSFGGGPDNPAAAAAGASGHISSCSSSAAETEVGGRGSGHLDTTGRFEGTDGLDGRKHHPNGRSPTRGSGGAGAPSIPPGVTMRNRVASPHDVAAPAAAREVGGGTEAGEVKTAAAASASEGTSYVVLVERCYVMVSCHRNHPLMFKVRHAMAATANVKLTKMTSLLSRVPARGSLVLRSLRHDRSAGSETE